MKAWKCLRRLRIVMVLGFVLFACATCGRQDLTGDDNSTSAPSGGSDAVTSVATTGSKPEQSTSPSTEDIEPDVSEDSATETPADEGDDDGDSVEVQAEQPPTTDDGEDSETGETKDADEAVAEPVNPFQQRVPVPDFPADMTWLNTSGPLKISDFKGKFVLLDFWTYCCINCMHILPELKKLEHAYPEELVVIGVHTAKFDTEKNTKNIAEAILRYEIEHPVINDADQKVWNTYGVRSWPTMWLIDPEGNAVYRRSGEFQFNDIAAILNEALPYYEAKGLLDRKPLHFDLLANNRKKTPLKFPGKLLADEKNDRLYIADSNHNRIVISKLDGTLVSTIGSGQIGRDDGDYASATFDHPQGMALNGDVLYVADTENHLLRKVDLSTRQVTTIAGKGEQGRNAWPGSELNEIPDRFVGVPAETAINSPWALWVHKADLYIAMAGPHQIWKMPLDESEIGPYAGNGREDIVDGPLLPPTPYQEGFSSFAQPSGLASDGKWLYVADSEGSSIRRVPFDASARAETVVGSNNRPYGRLFNFGDKDGVKADVLLQHALGVVHHEGKLYITDTYNNKIKVVDAVTGDTTTIAGTGEPGQHDEPAMFDEPAGITYAAGKLFIADTNNSLIRVVDLTNDNKVSTLLIKGLAPPAPAPKKTPKFSGAKRIELDPVQVRPADGKVTLQVKLALPAGWKINQLAPTSYMLATTAETGPVDRNEFGGLVSVEQPTSEFNIPLSVAGDGSETVQVSLVYYYCEDRPTGLCKTGSVMWNVPLEVSASATKSVVELPHQITP